jgi:hypothetical protein
MIKNKCEHLWMGPHNSGRDCNGGFVPNFFVCNNCGINLNVSEVLGLEQLEKQNKEINNLKKYRTFTLIISGIALLISFLTLI